tara:strand:- start:2 stop:724 length:723 start_codon:yes stop_codon:yes gene_type:complete
MPNQRNHKHLKAYNHIIDNIQDYMLTTIMFNKFSIKEQEKVIEKKKKTNVSNRITIKEIDQLFWYFYIALHGYDEYKLIDNKFTLEKSLKINNIQSMRANNSILKQQKLRISEYETTLLNSKKIDIPTLCGLSAYNQLNIIVIKNKTYYHFNFGDIDNAIIIYQEGNNYSCEVNPTKQLIETIHNNYYYVENPNKPIKGISTYKLNEIVSICNKLDIKTKLESGKSKNKKQLYTEILTYL